MLMQDACCLISDPAYAHPEMLLQVYAVEIEGRPMAIKVQRWDIAYKEAANLTSAAKCRNCIRLAGYWVSIGTSCLKGFAGWLHAC